jgi:D-cysteine desulfhydrase
MQLPFHHIFHASGTGMTQAGLLAGKALDGGDAQVHGISIARKSENGASHITKYLQAFLGKDAPLPQIDFVDAYAETYGVYTKPMVQTVQTMLTHYGIPLDMTYTGKAFYGMLEEIKARGLTGQNILFIHTGGTPLFFDKPEILV